MPAAAETPLATAASAAVPLRIADYLASGGPTGEDVRRVREEYPAVIGGRGDVLQMGGRKGEAAAAFRVLVDALAVLAFCPGGVRFCGSRYEATVPPEVP